ncbi:MAG: type II toxin-antitoxin system RelE/ParE family toxin, partial [Candidatus Eremiobacteraeota bacterium]|nr:type II toxin-antitoxin system RelE/ParE family toxin [Candidatus Eremiobacteraeota bacterium]
SPRKANATVQGILRKIKILRTMPYAGHRRLEFGPDVRTLVATPFVVFYRLLEHERVIEILRVIDGRRDLGTVFFSPLVAA